MSDEEIVPVERKAPLRTRVRAQQADLGLAWVSATLLGAIAIALTPDGLVLVRAVTPISVIAAYLTFAIPRSPQGIQKIADSAYFMGFLWTLWALIFVLISKAERLTAPALYLAFGHALVATGSGMAARLFLLQFYRSIGDQEDEAVDDIDDHLQAVRDRLSHHASAIAQDLEGIENIVRTAGVSLRKSSQRMTESVEKASEASSASAARLETAMNDLATRVDAISIPSTFVAEKLGRALDAVQLEMTKSVRGVSANIDGLGSELAATKQSIAEWAQNAQGIAAAASAAKGALSEVAGAVSVLVSNIGAAGGALKACTADVRTFQDVVSKSSTSLQTQVDRTKGELANLGSDIQEANAGARKVDTALREVVHFVQGNLRLK